jgi:DedD protein
MPSDLGSPSSAYRHADAEASDPAADQKRRARWRLLGALVFSFVVATAASQLMLQEPRPLAQDFVVLMPLNEALPDRQSPVRDTEEVADMPEGATASSPLSSERLQAPVVVAVTPNGSGVTTGETRAPARLSASASGGSRAWFVQLGAYDSQESASAMAVKVRGLGYTASVQSLPTAQGERYRVRVGPFSEAQAKAYLERARAQGYAPFLVRP